MTTYTRALLREYIDHLDATLRDGIYNGNIDYVYSIEKTGLVSIRYLKKELVSY